MRTKEGAYIDGGENLGAAPEADPLPQPGEGEEMTPNDIEVMIHYYGSRSVHPQIDAPAVQEATAMLLEAGLISSVEVAASGHGIYEPTEGGAMYVKMLCAVPFPERRWIDPRCDECQELVR